jgi:hypothetical protein
MADCDEAVGLKVILDVVHLDNSRISILLETEGDYHPKLKHRKVHPVVLDFLT